MTHLLSAKGRLALTELTKRRTLYAFDFDGTLAPLSPHRHEVSIPPSIHEWMKELTRRAPCAVVSGRALQDLIPRMNGLVTHLIGNHGLESACTSAATRREAEDICRAWARTLAAEMSRLPDHCIEVEHKRYSLTLHYQRAGDPGQTRLILQQRLTRLSPRPRLLFGHRAVNLLPPGDSGKGTGVLQLMKHLSQQGVFYIGDEETDETVFTLTEGLAVGVCVGKQTESHAKFYLNSRGEIEEVLQLLVHRLDRPPKLSIADKARCKGLSGRALLTGGEKNSRDHS